MKIIIFSIYIIFFTALFVFLKTDNVKENHLNIQNHVDNKKLIGGLNTLFIDSPEDDLFLYSRLFTSMGETGIQSLGEYDFNLLKKNVEKIIDLYLNSVDLFTESYYDVYSFPNKSDEWTNFIRGTLVYIEYLNSIGKQNKANKILEKNLYYTQQKIFNSKQIIDYMIAISNYKTLCEYIKSNKKNRLLRKYPLPDESIFFKKLEFEKEYYLFLYEEGFDSALKEKYSEDTLKQYKKVISDNKSKYLDNIRHYFHYYDDLAIAIKSDSSERIILFYETIEKEKNKLKFNDDKYIFLLAFPRGYHEIYDLHKKLIHECKEN